MKISNLNPILFTNEDYNDSADLITFTFVLFDRERSRPNSGCDMRHDILCIADVFDHLLFVRIIFIHFAMDDLRRRMDKLLSVWRSEQYQRYYRHEQFF